MFSVHFVIYLFTYIITRDFHEVICATGFLTQVAEKSYTIVAKLNTQTNEYHTLSGGATVNYVQAHPFSLTFVIYISQLCLVHKGERGTTVFKGTGCYSAPYLAVLR